MQDISSIYFSGIIQASDVVVAGARDIARRVRFLANSKLGDQFYRLNEARFQTSMESRFRQQEVAITYDGRASECLMMKSERVLIPAGNYTVGQLLCNLYRLGDHWVDALDDSRLTCTVNGREVTLFDPIAPGAAICISSRESVLEART